MSKAVLNELLSSSACSSYSLSWRNVSATTIPSRWRRPPAPRSKNRGRRRAFSISGLRAGALLVIALVSACTTHVSVSISQGKLDPAGEAQYGKVWFRGWTAVGQATPALRSCNLGGTKQECYDASEAMISALNGFLANLGATRVPSRYAKADADLRAALRTLTSGYLHRNQGIANNDDGDFVGGNDMLKQGDALLKKAYGALRDQAWVTASDSCGGTSVPCDAAAQEEPQPIVLEVAEAVADPAHLLDEQVERYLERVGREARGARSSPSVTCRRRGSRPAPRSSASRSLSRRFSARSSRFASSSASIRRW